MNLQTLRYFFVLGNNPTLSKIEILNLIEKLNIKFNIISSSKEILIIELSSEIEAKSFLGKLGGTVKIGEILEKIEIDKFQKSEEKILTDINLLSKLFDPQTKKLTFGISCYNGNFITRYLLIKIKKILQSSYRVNFIQPKGRFISSASVAKNQLIDHGFELVICAGEKFVYLGKTLAVQDFEDYSFRDYQRPGKDLHLGIIPPKLAKIMINLSKTDKNFTILDPFCGSGTIIQELILLGYKNIIASDFSQEQIQKTKQNIDWLFQKYQNLNQKEFNIKILNTDVRKISNTIPHQSINTIITEPYLGSPNLRYFDNQKIKKELNDLEKLYLNAFFEFKKILRENGVVVIIFPVLKINNQPFFLEILKRIKNMDFNIKNFLKDKAFQNLQLDITNRGSIIYSRPDQIINRELFIFSSPI